MALRLFTAILLVPAAAAASDVKTFQVYSDKITLKPGEVHNAWVKPLPLPSDVVRQFANRTMFLKGLQLDIVRIDAASGRESSVPLSEVYNHHHAIVVGESSRLESFYNKTRGKDPLAPDFPAAVERRLKHRGHGCLMHGAAMSGVLEEIRLSAGEGSQVASFGGATGAEFRGTPTDLPAPYAGAAANPQSFMSLMHFISTRGDPGSKSRLFECPCTSARKIDVANGTVDGVKVKPFECSSELLRQKNTGCGLETYEGGYRCCEHGVFLTEEVPGPEVQADVFFAKFTFSYYPELPGARPSHAPTCCDATGNETHVGNVEYDVPRCAEGTPPELCEHMITSVQPFDLPPQGSSGPKVDPEEVLELVHAWGHQHVGALSMELYNEQTGQLLCRTKPRYGTGEAAGDEKGFLVSIPPCVWGPPPLAPPPRLRRGDLLRTVARYNSTRARHGVMALWLMDAAPLARAARPDFLV